MESKFRFLLVSVWLMFSSLPIVVNAQTPLQKDYYAYWVAPTGPNNPRNSEASILELNDKRLLMAWSEFIGSDGSDWGHGDIAAMISRDGGRTWGEKFILQENIGKMNVMTPSLLRLQSGKILFIFARKNSEADLTLMSRISTDDAKTWSDAKVFPDPPGPPPSYWGSTFDRAIQLQSGRILYPPSWLDDYRVHVHTKIRPLYSDDEGNTWKESPTTLDVVNGTEGADEPAVVELKDGSVMMLIRTNIGFLYRSYSKDGGETWSKPERTDLVSPSAPASVKRIPSTGDLLLVWNTDHRGPHFEQLGDPDPLTTAISRDEGKTWEHILNLEDDPAYHGYDYATINFVDDRVLLTYRASNKRKGGSAGLKLRSVPLECLYR